MLFQKWKNQKRSKTSSLDQTSSRFCKLALLPLLLGCNSCVGINQIKNIHTCESILLDLPRVPGQEVVHVVLLELQQPDGGREAGEVHRRRSVRWLDLCPPPCLSLAAFSIFPLSSIIFTPFGFLDTFLSIFTFFDFFARSASFFDTSLRFLVPCLTFLPATALGVLFCSAIFWICVARILLFRCSVSHSFQASSVFFLVLVVFPFATSVP